MAPPTLRLRCAKQRNRRAGYGFQITERSKQASRWKGGSGLEPLLTYAGGLILLALSE